MPYLKEKLLNTNARVNISQAYITHLFTCIAGNRAYWSTATPAISLTATSLYLARTMTTTGQEKYESRQLAKRGLGAQVSVVIQPNLTRILPRLTTWAHTSITISSYSKRCSLENISRIIATTYEQ